MSQNIPLSSREILSRARQQHVTPSPEAISEPTSSGLGTQIEMRNDFSGSAAAKENQPSYDSFFSSISSTQTLTPKPAKLRPKISSVTSELPFRDVTESALGQLPPTPVTPSTEAFFKSNYITSGPYRFGIGGYLDAEPFKFTETTRKPEKIPVPEFPVRISDNVKLSLVLKMLRNSQLSLLDLLDFVLETENLETEGYRNVFYAKPNLTKLLDTISAHPTGQKHLDNWLLPRSVDMVTNLVYDDESGL